MTGVSSRPTTHYKYLIYSAEERTRTSTHLRAHDPESCASTNSATSAKARENIEAFAPFCNAKSCLTSRMSWDSGLAKSGTGSTIRPCSRSASRKSHVDECASSTYCAAVCFAATVEGFFVLASLAVSCDLCSLGVQRICLARLPLLSARLSGSATQVMLLRKPHTKTALIFNVLRRQYMPSSITCVALPKGEVWTLDGSLLMGA